MEKTAAIGSNCNLCWLIETIGSRKLGVSEVIKESDGMLIHPQDCRVMHRREHFREYFSWLKTTMGLPVMSASEPMQLDTNPPFETGDD